MGRFGAELRRERLARGVALEHITATTKICLRHLLALEQERFDLLPGGILNKGIIRGYASAVGLNQKDWTERFLRAYKASGQRIHEDDEHGWTAFALNVGQERIQRRAEMAARLHRILAILFLVVLLAGGGFAVHSYGVRAGWWPPLLPTHPHSKPADAAAPPPP